VTRVLYVLPTLDVGGAERSLLHLLSRLRGVDAHVCALGHGGALLASFQALGVPVHVLGLALGGADLRGGARLLPLVRRVRPDLLHARLFNANFWARVCGRLCGLPVLAEERGVEETRPGWATVLNRLSEPLGAITAGNSQAVLEAMRRRDRVPEARLRFVAGAVDADRFSPAEAGKDQDAVAVQRLDPRKGVPDLVEAFALLPEATLAIAGKGPMRAALEERVERLSLRGRVRLLGERHDVEALLRRSRVFVHASYEEGMPNAVLEAMACALPVVATRVAGSSEAVADGETGTLVPPRDPAALAAAVARYLGDAQLARRHGEAGRARAVAQFSYPSQAERYLELYRELLGGR
jgi:glycosyltransferase involved in cell wall biosynthesis